jgi:hypothetical protein
VSEREREKESNIEVMDGENKRDCNIFYQSEILSYRNIKQIRSIQMFLRFELQKQ